MLWIVFGLILVAGLFPEAPLGRLVRVALFGDPDRPDASFELSRFRKAVFLLLLLLMAGPAMPAELVVFFAGDVAIYSEVAMIVLLSGAADRLKAVVEAIGSVGKHCARLVRRVVKRPAPRARRKRGGASGQKSRKDVDEEPGWAFA